MRRPWVTSPSYQTAISHLIEARQQAGLSQREVADKLGKPRSFISKLEGRERRLDVVELIALARALGIKPGDLVEAISGKLPGPLEF
jgi:transcriptional regulator with XRE-family HTH domain